MAGMWFPAFVTATLAALIATPLLARRGAKGSRRRAPLATAAGPLIGVTAANKIDTFLTAYSQLGLSGATLDGQVTGLEAQRELGRWAYSNYVSLPAESTRILDLTLAGRLELGAGGSYELALVAQPTVTADTVAVTLRLPEGWRFGGAEGVRISENGRTARFSGPLEQDRILAVHIERDHGNGLWGRLQDGA